MAAKSGIDENMSLTPFAHGAAGHEGISSNASGSLIIKPCTQAEITFYESAKDHPEFQAHMPTFMGSLTQNNDAAVQQLISPPADGESASAKEGPQDNSGNSKWTPSGGKQLTTGLAIVLENAAAGFIKPNVLDLKLGARLWDDAAPEAKRQKLDQVAAETTSGSLGFRVAGMKTWLAGETETAEVNTELKDGYKSFNKNYGRTLTDDTVQDAFTRFVGGISRKGTSTGYEYRRDHARQLLQRILREVESIEYVLEQTEIRMYSASILIVLEGDDAALTAGLAAETEAEAKARANVHTDDEEEAEEEEEEDDDDDENLGPQVLQVRLIDFAHATWTPGQGPDENVLRGVRNVRQILSKLVS